MQPQNRLEQLFSNLDRWRHLPNYQLERRVDIFFSLYLRDIVQAHVRSPVHRVIVPEMPLKRQDTRHSTKVDYVLFAEDLSRVYFIELKTDCASRRSEQDEYLLRAMKQGFPAVLRDLVEVISGTNSVRKYCHLLQLLADAGQVTLTPEFLPGLFGRARRAPFRAQHVQIIALDAPIEIVYIQPMPTDSANCITFQQVAETLGHEADPVTVLFRKHLLRWCDRAGAMMPGGCDVAG